MADDPAAPDRLSPSDRRLLAWIVAGAVLLALGLRLAVALASGFQVDDAWITYRYAEHIAQGEGFVYNPGRPVYGTTTPLLTLLLALPARLGLDLPAASLAIGLAATAATLVLLAILAAPRVGAGGTALLLGLVAIAPGHVVWTVSGMETALYCAFLAGAALAFDRGRWGWLGLVAGGAFLTRFDAVVLLVAIAIALPLSAVLRRHRGAPRPGTSREDFPAPGTNGSGRPAREVVRGAGRAAVGFLGVAGPWLVFATRAFGSPVPNSVWAKLGMHRAFDTELALEILRAGLAPGVLPFPVEAVLTVAGLAALLLRPRLQLLPIWFGGLLAFFFVGRVHLHPWYPIPLHPFALTAWVLGLGPALAGRLDRVGRARMRAVLLRSRRRGVALAAGACLLLAVAAVPAAVVEAQARQETHERSHAALGRFLAARSAPGQTVYAWDIGYVGHLSGRPILDAIGIVSPEVIPYNRRGAYADVLLDFRPEWALVALWTSAGQEIVEDPRVRAAYRRLDRTELVLRAPDGSTIPVGGEYAVLRLR